MWGEIISAGASLLGGLFGKKKQKVSNEVDYVKMAANAQAAGFNPLTAIRNGGSAGFTTTTSPSISAMPEVLGNLGGILGNALDNKLDPIEAKKREIDTILLDRQLGQLKQGPQLPASFKTPRTYTGTKVSSQLAPRVGPSATTKAASVPAAYKPLNPNLVAGKPPEASDVGLHTPNRRYGIINPGWIPDAGGALSDAYGEPGEWVGGVANMAATGLYSIYRNARSAYEDGSRIYQNGRRRESKAPAVRYTPASRLGGWAGRRLKPAQSGGGGW